MGVTKKVIGLCGTCRSNKRGECKHLPVMSFEEKLILSMQNLCNRYEDNGETERIERKSW